MIVDVHAHVVPAEVLASVRRGDWGDDVALRPRDGGGESLVIEGKGRGGVPGRIADLDDRLATMDRQGVDVQLISSWVGAILHNAGPDLATSWALRFNEALADLVDRRPERLRALGQVALQAPDSAAAELRRIMTDSRFVGLEITTRVGQADLGDPSFEPVWQAAADTGALVLIHPDKALSGRLGPGHALANGVGNPVETTIAATSLMCAGVLDRHPDLRVCLVHGGGTFPFQVGRLDQAHATGAPELGSLPQPPSAYARRFLYDTVVHALPALRYVIDAVGVDRVVLGTDHPFVMGLEDPLGHLDALGGLAAAERAAIEGGTMENLLPRLGESLSQSIANRHLRPLNP